MNETPPTSNTPRVLVVDDEPDAARNLVDILNDLGFQADAAFDGPTALQLAEANVYDVALLDLKMPGMNGVELYQRIKAACPGTAAIVVTAFSENDLAQAARAAGATEIVSKPVDLQRLVQHVEDAVGQPVVMIVDDDPELCDALSDVLRSQSFRTAVAHDVESARRQLARRGYHVVLIDMRLPGGDGREIFEFVRKAHATARTVLITGYRSETELQVAEVLAQGADAVAYKPFDLHELIATLKRLLAEKKPSS